MDLFGESFDLDVELSKDTTGTCLRQVKDALQQGQSAVRRTMDRGLSGEEFKKAEALQKAFEAATVAVDAAWHGFHGT